jgi:hypothetical protein
LSRRRAGRPRDDDGRARDAPGETRSFSIDAREHGDEQTLVSRTAATGAAGASRSA